MSVISVVRGCFVAVVLIIHTIIFGVPVMILGLFKLARQDQTWQDYWTPSIVWLCEAWGLIVGWLSQLIIPVQYNLNHEGPALSKQGSYLVLMNHQSMTDVPVMIKLLVGTIPFMRFFIKAELKKLPIFGFAWQSVDCPFMRRYSKEYLEQNPHMKGKDLEETIRSCARLRHKPAAIAVFVEGTRFTPEKHKKLASEFTYLLPPKAGGVALAITAMEGQLEYVLDTTLFYHQPTFELWDFMCGRIREVTVDTRVIPIPAHFHSGDYQNDPKFRIEFQEWLNQLWRHKDQRLAELHQLYRLN